MLYTQLGRTGLSVSRLCLGTMNFGVDTSEPDSFAIMDRALELGINFFDTADVYGRPLGKGLTEELIGRWLAQGGGRRERIILATKVYGPMGPLPHQRGLSAAHIRRACDQSLRRLGVETLDLFQMHHVDRGYPSGMAPKWMNLQYMDQIGACDHGPPWQEIWQAMDQLIAAGKVVYVGSSNFAAWNVAQANTLADARGSLGLVSEQSKYNLATRTVELEVVPACRALGVGILPYSPAGGGLLAGALTKTNEGRRGSLSDEIIARYRPKLEAYESLCRSLGEHPAQVAAAWLLQQPAVTAPIIGPRTMEQLETSVRALDIRMSAEILARLDEIWPGPGNQAPEAYAW